MDADIVIKFGVETRAFRFAVRSNSHNRFDTEDLVIIVIVIVIIYISSLKTTWVQLTDAKLISTVKNWYR
jgi:hypothetical protein